MKIEKIENWYQKRSLREKYFLLAGGLFIFCFCVNIFIKTPLQQKKVMLQRRFDTLARLLPRLPIAPVVDPHLNFQAIQTYIEEHTVSEDTITLELKKIPLVVFFPWLEEALTQSGFILEDLHLEVVEPHQANVRVQFNPNSLSLQHH